MGLFASVRALFDRTTERTVRECRHCGTSIQVNGEECPCCGRQEVVEFDVD